MTDRPVPRVGLLLGTFIAPEDIPRVARRAETLGFDELWLAEDYFYTGAFAAVTAALASTERIPVGAGIVSALVRHPAVLAMEIATVTRMYPGRFRPGIALGHPPAMRQAGLYPRSPLRAVRECVTTVRALLAGQEVTLDGTVHLDRIKLAHPPTDPVPLYQGGMGPKMIQLAGETADGVIVPLMASPDYVRWVRDQITLGAARAGRDDRRSVVVFLFLCIDRDREEARNAVRSLAAFYLHEISKVEALPPEYGLSEEMKELARSGVEQVERSLQQRWPDDLTAVGEPDHCIARIHQYFEAGADSVVLYPMPAERAESIIDIVGAEILPRLNATR